MQQMRAMLVFLRWLTDDTDEPQISLENQYSLADSWDEEKK